MDIAGCPARTQRSLRTATQGTPPRTVSALPYQGCSAAVRRPTIQRSWCSVMRSVCCGDRSSDPSPTDRPCGPGPTVSSRAASPRRERRHQGRQSLRLGHRGARVRGAEHRRGTVGTHRALRHDGHHRGVWCAPTLKLTARLAGRYRTDPWSALSTAPEPGRYWAGNPRTTGQTASRTGHKNTSAGWITAGYVGAGTPSRDPGPDALDA
jgi:hypothetical protein